MSFCNTERFFHKLDELKATSRITHNLFLDGHELKNMASLPATRLIPAPDSVFLLNRKHGQWDDILFATKDLSSLQKDLGSLIPHLTSPAKVSIIGAEQAGQAIADIFSSAGFSLGRKIARMRNHEDMQELKKKIETSEEEQEREKEAGWEVDFAMEGEEAQVLELLQSAFDLRADNLPQLEEIRDNIERKQVFVIRDQDKLVACHYFTKKNNMAFGWYDITAREYRKKFLYFYMLKFQYKFWENEPKVKRSYSWRDCNNKRIMALAAQSSQFPDGVYIYNMIYG